MGIPELHHDETVILQTHNIKVKSVMFDAVLTNKRLMLIDSKKGLIPPQEILIATISTVEPGENAIRDPILTFTIFSKGSITRQMILTFPREASGDRRRERDDWLKVLREHLSSPENFTEISGTTAPEQESPKQQDISFRSFPESSGSAFQKKKIEIARPRRNIIETIPAMPRPIETTTLPVGTFCNRCGNRVPPESAFCNRCGTPVVNSPEEPSAPLATISATPVSAPQPVIPQVQVPTPPVFGLGGDRKERTLEEVIHSIEPLIEDSKPRSREAAPLVPRHYPAPPVFVETPVPESPAPAAEVSVLPTGIPETAPAEKPDEKPDEKPEDNTVPAQESPAAPSIPTPPTAQSPPPAPKKPNFVAIAVIAIVILAIIGGVVIFSNIVGTAPGDLGTTPTPSPVPVTILPTMTPVPTPAVVVTTLTIATPVPQPAVIIPPNGVWVRITYPGNYSGTYGTPGSQTSVGEKNTGDRFFMISTINGPVEASIQKMDGSADELVIEVYKNGNLMKRETTVSPKGIIEFQVDLKPQPTPTPLPTQTIIPTTSPDETAVNSAGNVTGTA